MGHATKTDPVLTELTAGRRFRKRPNLSVVEAFTRDDRDRHEARFRTGRLDAQGQVDLLAQPGLDFIDDWGEPLRCLKRFARPAEAAARNIAGIGAKMPERSQVAVQTFEDTLEKDARAFLASKRKRAAT